MSELTKEQRLVLHGLVSHSGYQILLDLMEMEREKAVTELLRANPSKTEEVISAHNTARAFAVFIERIQKAINFQIAEGLAEVAQVSTEEEPDYFGISGLTDAPTL